MNVLMKATLLIITHGDERYHVVLGGICEYNNGTVSNCYNIGNFINDNNHEGFYAAGIIAFESNSVIIENCYTIGNAPKSDSDSAEHVAIDQFATATNCYYNVETCSGTDTVATGLTTTEMKASSFVTLLGDSFEADVNNINNGYPVLKWENQ